MSSSAMLNDAVSFLALSAVVELGAAGLCGAGAFPWDCSLPLRGAVLCFHCVGSSTQPVQMPGKSKSQCASPSTPSLGSFKPLPRCTRTLLPGQSGRSRPSPPLPPHQLLVSAAPDLLVALPSAPSLDLPMRRHVWLQKWGLRGRRRSQRSCSGLDLVPNGHLPKQLLPQLHQMWAAACDSAAWCLPLPSNRAGGGPLPEGPVLQPPHLHGIHSYSWRRGCTVRGKYSPKCQTVQSAKQCEGIGTQGWEEGSWQCECSHLSQ